VGVDLGATKVASALVGADGRVLRRSYRLIRAAEGPSAVVEDVVSGVRACLDAGRPAPSGLGIGVAGQVDADTGVVRFAPNLAWRNVRLAEALSRDLEMPVTVANDVRAATVGEWRFGAGRGCGELVCVFVGTGIGGSIVSGGRLLAGCANAAGEIGHMTLVAGGRRCHCPNVGCLEAYAGGWAIAERAREAALEDPRAGERLVERAGTADAISAATVSELARAGDALARRIVDETAEFLAAGMVAVVNAFNPCRLLLGGGVVRNLPPGIVAVAREAVRRRCQPPAARAARVREAALGADAGVIGAAWLARERGAVGRR
jgi:glucokinase